MFNSFKKAAVVAAVAVSAPIAVAADTITLDQVGSNTYARVNLSASSVPGYNGPTNQLAGGFNVTDGISNFTAWCVELTETLALGVTDGYNDDDTPATITTASITDNLSRLFTGFASTLSATDAIQQAAFQVAIWEIVYDDGLSLGAGAFQMSDHSTAVGVNAQANTYLSALSGLDANYDMSYFTGAGTQDLVTGTLDPNSQTPAVPLPATGLLLIAGLGALGMAGRRKRA